MSLLLSILAAVVFVTVLVVTLVATGMLFLIVIGLVDAVVTRVRNENRKEW